MYLPKPIGAIILSLLLMLHCFTGVKALLLLQVQLSIKQSMWNDRSALISSAGVKIKQKVWNKTKKWQNEAICGFIDLCFS